MSDDGLIDRAAEVVRQLPGLRQWRQAAFDRHFAHNTRDNLFRGVFATAEAALASAPPSRPQGYDNQASSALYLKRLAIDDHDYPAMFWLQRSLDEGLLRIADLGGSVGIKYFAFEKVFAFPPGLQWRVIDVPAVAARGREFAASLGAGPALQFSDSLAELDGMQVLYASGVLQYLPVTLAELLGGLRERPRRLIVNTTPIHAERTFFTLNSIGTAYCAYRVEARQAFVAEVERCGYRLRGEWRNLGKQMSLPFDRASSLRSYAGFCFDALD
ncbi:MAG TPA: methyltransferase, TIGR04325 family [Ideonella sp.]|nr:methyltransferase, TIGR04325 family [Ideonella sp.]